MLPPRATLRVTLGRTRDCAFEVRATFEGGDEMRRRVDLCRNPRVAFADTGPRREVEVVNQSDQGLRELYLAAPGTAGGAGNDAGGRTGWAARSSRPAIPCGCGCATCPAASSISAPSSTMRVEEVRERQDICRMPRLAFGDSGLPLREVTVTNAGGRTLRELYARTAGGAADSDAWGGDRLGSSMVEPRADFRLRLRGAGCAWDLRAVFDDDREEVQRGLDVCAAPAVPSAGPRWPRAATRQVTLVNGFSQPVQQAFVSPAESDSWGPDVLGDAVLAPGGAAGGEPRGQLPGGSADHLREPLGGGTARRRYLRRQHHHPAAGLDAGGAGRGRPAEAARAGEGGAAAGQHPAAQCRGPAGGGALRRPAGRGAARAGPAGQSVLGAGESLDFAPPEDLPAGPSIARRI